MPQFKLSDTGVIVFAKPITIPANRSDGVVIFQNDTSLENGIPYLVTAEILAIKTGSGYDGHHYYFTDKYSNGRDARIGIPAIIGYQSNLLDLGGSSQGPGSDFPGVPGLRFSAQAVIENGLIRLVCFSMTDSDPWYINLIIRAERINNTSRSDYYDRISFWK
jgi:hypothetical protein